MPKKVHDKMKSLHNVCQGITGKNIKRDIFYITILILLYYKSNTQHSTYMTMY